MKLGVYSLKKVIFQGEAKSVNCVTRMGEVTILDGHEPLISILDKGTMTIVDNAEEIHYIPVLSGFLEVNAGSQVKALVEESVKE